MSDVVERLLAGAGGGKHWMELHTEAADKIESLRKKVEEMIDTNFILCAALEDLEESVIEKKENPIREVAQVIEQLEGNQATIQWLYNPVPDGQYLLWDHGD